MKSPVFEDAMIVLYKVKLLHFGVSDSICLPYIRTLQSTYCWQSMQSYGYNGL